MKRDPRMPDPPLTTQGALAQSSGVVEGSQRPSPLKLSTRSWERRF